VPSEVEVNYWFEKHRVIAAGLAGCGAGIGNLVLPPVLDFLIEEFGWRNTCVLLSGLGKRSSPSPTSSCANISVT